MMLHIHDNWMFNFRKSNRKSSFSGGIISQFHRLREPENMGAQLDLIIKTSSVSLFCHQSAGRLGLQSISGFITEMYVTAVEQQGGSEGWGRRWGRSQPHRRGRQMIMDFQKVFLLRCKVTEHLNIQLFSPASLYHLI